MTVSLAFTSTVNYNASNFATVLTEFCETWLVDRGWSVSPQPVNPTPATSPDPAVYGWFCEKNVRCVDETVRRYGKVIAGTSLKVAESSWQPGEAIGALPAARTDYYNAYSTATTSEVQGQWKMYTDDTDDDFFLLTIGGKAVTLWPPSGSLFLYSRSTDTDTEDPIWELEPLLFDRKDQPFLGGTATDGWLSLITKTDGLEQDTAPTLYQYAMICGNDNPLFEDVSGITGMLAGGDRSENLTGAVNTLYDQANATYYIRIGSGNGGSILLNHGSVNPNL